jgi:Eco57I restriction-modification methylase/restriction endonuclease TaqI-like protein
MASPHPTLDLDLSQRDLQDLGNADALAAFFARLGYRTEVRIEQTPGNLGVPDSVHRAIKSIQLLAEQDDGFQVYLFELASVTLAQIRDLGRALKDRVGIFLLVLTSDYERIDFVFLERYLPHNETDVLPGMPKLLRHKVRPRVLTVERRKPDAVHLRVLRRFTWTEADGYAQQDKIVNAYSIADWSEQFFNNRALFSDHYLLTRLKDRSEWEEDSKPAYRELRQLYRGAAARFGGQPRAALRDGLLVQVLSGLGFTFQPGSRSAGKPREKGDLPGYPLYAPGGDAPLAYCLDFPWGRFLDGKDDRRDTETADLNPGAIVVSRLERGEVPWVVLTNGKTWRLYARRAHSRATNYYEIDLEEVLDSSGPLAADPAGSFRYFWLLFRRRAFELRASRREGLDLQESLLDELLAESADYARKLGESLKDNIFDLVFPQLAAGFAADLRRSTPAEVFSQADLDLVFRGTLTFLYRLLFLLYAEARDLLPVREVRGYYEISLTRMRKEIADTAGPSLTDSAENVSRRYRDDSFELYNRLMRLFRVIDLGDADVNVPVYNGGLFLSNPGPDDFNAEAKAARFLLSTRIADAPLARALDRLARDEDPKGNKLAPIDYKSLGVRQLGSIYEGLLEFRLRVAREEMAVVKGKKTEEVIPLREAHEHMRKILKAGRGAEAAGRILKPGAVYLENDKRERKATGSYYTPDFVVEYIISKTVGPPLERNLEALRPTLREAERWHRQMATLAKSKGEPPTRYEYGPAVEKKWGDLGREIFDLRVLDPAMGSGHFLVEAVDFITDKILYFLSAFRWNPVFAHLEDLRQTILGEMEKQGISIDEGKLTDVNLLKRHVLKRCIFGVDLNPMAVELAKVSLWLDCFTLGAPLSFLDHHLRCGNSLLGVTVEEVEDAVLLTLFGGRFTGLMLATKLMASIGGMPDVTNSQTRESREAFQEASNALAPFIRILDIYTTRWFSSSSDKEKGKKGQGLTEIDFLKAPETQSFLYADHTAKARKELEALPDADRVFAEKALEKARSKRFFHWELGFPEVFYGLKPGTQMVFIRLDNGGFDAVIGNPPWVRQEGLKEMKTAIAAILPDTYDSEADVYTHILARGIQVLRRGGRLGMILQNKWLKAEYAQNLRGFLTEVTTPIEVVDFRHAPLFDADTFPCILLVEKCAVNIVMKEKPESMRFFEVEKEDLPGIDLSEYGERRKVAVPLFRLRPEGWNLLSSQAGDLLEKIVNAGPSLREFAGSSPLYGIKTGLNKAFLIDQKTRDRLVDEDPNCGVVIEKFLRGENVRRWCSPWDGEWIVLLASSQNHVWPWSAAKDEDLAESKFRSTFPSLHRWMKLHEHALRRREDQGTFWWELRSCDYYSRFEQTKLVYKDLSFHSQFSFDKEGLFTNDLCFFLPQEDLWLVALLNSSLLWWYLAISTLHGKDEALRLKTNRMEMVPVVESTSEGYEVVIRKTEDLVVLVQRQQSEEGRFLSWLEREMGVEVSRKLETYWKLREMDFGTSLGKKGFAGSPLGKVHLVREFLQSRRIVRELRREICRLEVDLHQRVFDLYGLTQEEVGLMRETAPPRDPLALAEQELAELERGD